MDFRGWRFGSLWQPVASESSLWHRSLAPLSIPCRASAGSNPDPGGLEACRLGGLEAWSLGGLQTPQPWRLGGWEACRPNKPQSEQVLSQAPGGPEAGQREPSRNPEGSNRDGNREANNHAISPISRGPVALLCWLGGLEVAQAKLSRRLRYRDLF